MWNFLLLSLTLCAPHGGQYIPPLADPDQPPELEGIVSQPGLGPELVFKAYRWEWWFDFNQEPLLALRQRMPQRARTGLAGSYEPLTDDDRTSVVLPALVDAMRKKPPVPGEIRHDQNNRDIRAAAVLALGRLKRPEAVPYIQLVLESDPDLFVRTQAILALGFSGSPQAVEDLVRMYHDEHEAEELRTYAIVGLALIGNGQAQDTLRTALTEKALAGMRNQLRAATIYAAGICGDPSLGAPLRALASSWLFEKDADVRALTSMAMGGIDDPASVPFLLTQLTDADNQVRRSAAVALEASSARLDKASVEAMIKQYGKDADQGVRLNLLRALGNARLPESREFLREALASATYEYRPHVAIALALDGDAGNAPPLLTALAGEKDLSSISALGVALGLLQAPQAAEPLLKIFEETHDPATRGYLCLALGLIDPPQPDLAERIGEVAKTAHDVELVRSAMLGLGLLGARDRLDQLAAGVGAVKGTIERATQLHGLGLVGDRHVLPFLLAVQKDDTQPSYVRTYALQALGELADPRDISPCSRLSSHVELNHEVGFLFELYRVL